MFDTLDDQMKHDREAETSRTGRIMQWVAALAATVLVLGVLYFGAHHLG